VIGGVVVVIVGALVGVVLFYFWGRRKRRRAAASRPTMPEGLIIRDAHLRPQRILNTIYNDEMFYNENDHRRGTPPVQPASVAASYLMGFNFK
jgi:hypothetical protein